MPKASLRVVRKLSRDAVSKHVRGAKSIELRYGVSAKALGLLSLAIGLLGIVLVGVFNWRELLSLEPSAMMTALVVVPISLFTASLFPETFFVKHRADEQGVTLGSPFRRPVRFAWNEIRSVDYNTAAHWFAFRGIDGRVGRVSPLIGGLRTFATLSLARLDRARFTKAGWQRMRDAAAGRPLIGKAAARRSARS